MRLPLQTPRAAGLVLRALRAGLSALAALVLVTCTDNPIGPGRLTPAALQVRPVFDASARFAPLVLTSARLIVVRPASDTIARVTGNFNASTNQVQLTATVLLHGLSEDLDVTLELYAGSVLIFSGTQRLTVSGSGGGQPQSVPVTYQGPGSGATSVSIAPQDTTVLTGSLTPMRATADSLSVPVTQFYASWSLLGAPAGASIDASGQLTAPATRDTFQVVVSTPSGLADTTFVYVAAAPATLVRVSGDGQTATASSRLAQPLVVRLDGNDALPVSGVPVTFAVVTGGGALDSAVVITDAAGLASMGATLGATVGSQTFSATAAGVPAVTFSATATAGGTVRTWNGAVDGNWTTAGNWTPSAVPGAGDSVVVVAGTPNDPDLAGNATIRALTLQGANAALTVSGNLTVSGSIALPDSFSFVEFNSGQLSAGSVTIAGFSAFIDDLVGSTTITGATTLSGDQAFVEVGAGSAIGTLALTGNAAFFNHGGGTQGAITASGASAFWEADGAAVTVNGATGITLSGTAFASSFGPAKTVTVNGGITIGGTGAFLDPGNGDHWIINGNLQTTGGGTLRMTATTDSVEVNGNAFFGGGDESTRLTAGQLFVSGNLSQTGLGTAFVGSGSHIVFLDGGGAQSVNFAAPGFSAARFANVIIANSAGGVTVTSDVYATGTVGVTPTAVRTLSGNGSTLFTTILNVSNFTFNNLLLNFAGSAFVTFDTVTFQGYAPTATPLTVVHPGAAAPLDFQKVTFTVTPTSGFYLDATDSNPSDGVPLVIDMTNPTPAAGGSFVQTSGATVNWPAGSSPGTWTGAVDTSWNTAGNWAGGTVPTTSTDVVIPAGTPRAPTITVIANAHDVTVQPGATLTINLSGLNVSGSLDAAGTIVGTTTSVNLTGTGTARGTLTGSFFSLLVNGSYSLNGRLVTPGITINGSLTLAGHTASVGSSVGDDFQTSNNGVLVMTNANDSLIVGGTGPSVVFDGGSTAGRLTAGVILLNSSSFSTFQQDNIFNDSSYAPSGTHKVVLATGATLSLDFATPGTGSHFNILDISAQSPGFSLATPIRVNGAFLSTPAATAPAINGGNRLFTLAGPVQVTGLTLTNAPFAIAGDNPVTFDNVTLQSFVGAATQLTVSGSGAAARVFNNLIFNTTPTTGFYVSATDTDGATANGPLTVDLVNPAPATDGGHTQVANGAVINWPAASPAKTWTGSVSTDWNLAGNWTPSGVPIATSDVIVPSGPSNQPLVTGTFTINSLAVAAGATVNLNGNVLTVSGNVLADGTINAPGQITMTGTALVRGALPTLNVLLGGVVTATGPLTVTGGLNISGAGSTFVVGGQTVTVSGTFANSSGGLLNMTNPADHLIVASQATFNGGNELGLLSAGVLEIGGNLTQSNASSNDAFHPSGTHLTLFTGSTVALQFASPGNAPGSSHFEQVRWTGTGTLALNSDVYAHGTFDGNPGISGTILSANRLLQVGNLVGGGATLDNTRLVIDGTTGGPIALDNISFSSMGSNVTQLTVLHPGTGGPFTFNNLTFSGVPTTGFYLAATDVDGSTNGFLTLDLANPTPPTPGAFTQVTNGAVINWPATSPVKTWTGAATSDWQTSTNWSPAGIPGVSDDVVIPATANNPVMSAAATIHSLTVQTGVLLNLNSFALTVNGDVSAPNATSFAGGGGALNLVGTGRTIGGTLSTALPVNASGTYSLSARTVIGNLTVSSTGDVAANGHTLVVGGALNTANTGTITMTNALDSVLVTGAGIFGGGFTGGRLTAGYLKIGGSFNQTSANTPGSFAASGSHTTELGAAAVRVVTFASPGFGTGTSQFNNLIVTGATGGLTLNSNIALLGTLISLPSATTPTMTATGGRTITVRGGTLVVGLFIDGAPVTLDLGGGGSFQFDDAIFQNMPTGVNQLTILHPGTSTPIVLTDLVFNNVPAAGAFYISATDADGASPDALVLDLVAPTPGTSGGFSQALNGAVINWPQAAPAKTWTGSVSTDWSVAGNWTPAGVPTATDDVVIPVGTPLATVSSSCTARTLTVGGTLSLGPLNCTVLGNVTATGVISGTSGAVVLTAAALIEGNFPNLVISAPVSLANSVGLGSGNGNVTITGVGAALTLNGHTLVMPGNLSVQGAGVLVMTNPTDILTVQGNAVFDGGDETGKLTAGVLSVFGNFSQAATSSGASFQASSTHQTILGGSAITVGFATPGTSGPSSRFQELSWNQNGTMTLNSDMVVAGLYQSFGGNTTIIGASERVLTTGGFDPGGVKTFDNVRLIVSPTFGGPLDFNNLVFQNMQPTSIQLQVLHPGTGGPFSWVGLTFSTVPTTGFYLSVADINTGDGVPLTIDVLGTTPAAGGSFVQTAGGAVVNWPAGAGTVTWTGATSTDWFTASNWAGGVVPTGASDVVIPAATPNAPSLNSNTAINSLTVQSGAVLTTNDISLDIAGNVDASGLVIGCCGDFIGLTNGTLRGNFDNVVLNVAGGGVVTLNGGTFLTNSSVQLSGELILAGNPFSTPQLQVVNGGLLTMTNAADLVVASSVTFAGGDETGHLTSGAISTQDFTQGNTGTGGGLSFVASGAHQVLLGGPSGSQVTFATPGLSHFQGLNLSGVSGTATLNSDVTVTGLLAATPSGLPSVVTSAVGARLTAGDLITTGLTFNAVPLVLTDLVSPLLQRVTFQSMDPTITQLTASGAGAVGPFTFDTLDFQTTPTTGLYIQLNDLDGPSPNALTVNVTNSTPAAGAPFIQANNGAVLNWTPPPAFNWTGTASSDWFTGANWSGGNVPGSTDSPVILTSAPNQPVLSTDATVANLTIQPGATVDIGINNLVLNGALDDGGTITGTGRGTVVLAGAGQFARGAINATVTVSGNYTLNGRLTVNGSLSVNGPTAVLVLNTNTAAVTNFTAGVGALLVMVNGTDSLIVAGDVIMDGGDLTSLLTAGTITIDGNFVQSATSTPKSFNPTGTHKVVFGPGTSHTVFFASPLPTDSRFQLLTISTTGPVSLLSDATVLFDLDITAGALDINGHTLTVGGAFRTSGNGTFIQQQVTDSIAVQGAAVFGGGSTSGNLTNGFLRVAGSLTQTAGTSSTSFAPSGSHTTSLGAVAARAVNFATPGTGAGGSHFANLLATLATGGLTLNSDVFIDGQLITQVGGPTPLIVGGGKTVTVKQFAVQGLKVDNAPMILNEGTAILAQQFDGVTFQNFPTAGVTQLTLNVAGAALTVRPITFNNTTFTHLATVGAGAFYVKSTSSNGLGSVLTLSGASESPQIGGNGPSFTQATAPASVNWP